MDIMGYIYFLPKTYIQDIFLPRKNSVHYWTSHKHSAETVINASEIINKFIAIWTV